MSSFPQLEQVAMLWRCCCDATARCLQANLQTRHPATRVSCLCVPRGMPKEQYMCQLCANHGVFNQPKKGHKQKCLFKECPCSLCALNLKRRALDQIERQLKSSTDPSPSSTSTSSTSTAESSPILIDTLPSSPPSSSVTFPPDLPPISYASSSTTHSNAVNKKLISDAPIDPPRPTALRTTPNACLRKSPIITKSGAFMVALPPTITKKELKRSLQLREQQAKRAKSIDEAIENLHNRQQNKSIFCSAELLAG